MWKTGWLSFNLSNSKIQFCWRSSWYFRIWLILFFLGGVFTFVMMILAGERATNSDAWEFNINTVHSLQYPDIVFMFDSVCTLHISSDITSYRFVYSLFFRLTKLNDRTILLQCRAKEQNYYPVNLNLLLSASTWKLLLSMVCIVHLKFFINRFSFS